MNPLVSVIIPTYNRAQSIKKALDSVLEQTYTSWECLVIDDGSTDNTSDILKQYTSGDHKFTYVSRERSPKGAPTCRNIGLELAKGDFVIFLDSDDYLLPFCLKQRVEQINKQPKHDFWVFPKIEEKKGKLVSTQIPENLDYLKEFLSANALWQTMCPIWDKAFLLKLGGFSEGYPRFNDVELTIRALLESKLNYRVLGNSKPDCVFIPSEKRKEEFIDKVYEGLMLFVPDTVSHLEQHGKGNQKKYLVYYLYLWFKYYYVAVGNAKFKHSSRLLRIFYNDGIINRQQYINLFTRLYTYMVTNMIGYPLDKLSDKSFYKFICRE